MNYVYYMYDKTIFPFLFLILCLTYLVLSFLFLNDLKFLILFLILFLPLNGREGGLLGPPPPNFKIAISQKKMSPLTYAENS